ncbi:hypothetical protein PORY_000220 [Pneumocystis oryctolagi]|uniref:Uncharacterized protein n=1 Tax=Pneumocystis oryctolagi TaxID=42067 RepID=A0ACB7CGE8_9ASCO|nr:hypothetical protein PORY_000220 [Pneumocystis oryctolagi]
MSQDFKSLIDITSKGAENFINVFFKCMDNNRDVIYQFYRPFSTIVWNGNAFTGLYYAEFVKKLPSSYHEVQSFDCHPMTSSMNEYGACSIVLVVSGSVRYGNESEPRGFSDTFVLKSDLEKQGMYYIASQCFRQDLKKNLDIPGFPWKKLIFSFIIAQYVFEQFLMLRQYKKLCKKKPPVTLENIIDQETFDKSQTYGRAKAKFVFVTELYGLIQKMLVMKYDVLPRLYSFVQLEVDRFFSEKNSGEILYSLFFFFILNIGILVLNLPASIYSTFVLEEKFGFNKQTPTLFVVDLLKSQLILIVIGGPVLCAFLKIILYFGQIFFYYLWLFVFVFQIVMILIYPVFIQPLFNKLTPLPDGELKLKVEKLALDLKFPLKKIYVIDGSKRSAHSNAYFFGLPWNKHIVIYDTLIEKSETMEIVAILAHELGHWALYHISKMLVVTQIHIFFVFMLFSVFIQNTSLYRSFGFYSDMPILIGFVLYNDILTPINSVLTLFINIFSRKNEFQADAFASKLHYKNELSRALIKLHVQNLSAVDTDWLYSSYHYSHPILSERLRALGLFSDVRRTALRKALILSFDTDDSEILAKSKQAWEALIKYKLKQQKGGILSAISYRLSSKEDSVQLVSPREFHSTITTCEAIIESKHLKCSKELIYEVGAILKSSYGSFTLSSTLDVDKIFYLKDLANKSTLSLFRFIDLFPEYQPEILNIFTEYIEEVLASLRNCIDFGNDSLVWEEILTDNILNFKNVFLQSSIIISIVKSLKETVKYLNTFPRSNIVESNTFQKLFSYSLRTTYFCCIVLNDFSLMSKWFDKLLKLSHEGFGVIYTIAIQDVFAAIAVHFPDNASVVIQYFRMHILHFSDSNNDLQYNEDLTALTSRRLTYVLKNSSQDAIITTIYSLTNSISSNTPTAPSADILVQLDERTVRSSMSLVFKTDTQKRTIHYKIVDAITQIAIMIPDEKISALSISILIQKYGKIDNEVDRIILEKLADVTKTKSEKNVMSIIKFYSRVAESLYGHGLKPDSNVFRTSLANISSNMEKKSELLTFYLNNLLNIIIGFNKVPEKQNETEKKHQNKNLKKNIQDNIVNILYPLAILLQKFDDEPSFDSETILLFCNMWFTLVLCGFIRGSALTNQNIELLKIIATYSPPLVLDNATTHFESDLELNTILRRGGSQKEHHFLRDSLSKALPSCTYEIKSASYSKTVYLSSVFLLETLRSSAGICSYTFTYLKNTNIKESDISTCISSIAHLATDVFISSFVLSSKGPESSALLLKEMKRLLLSCSHRMKQPRELALKCCDKVVSSMPSVLCSQSVLYTLLESLSLLWYSCANQYLSEYTPQYIFSSSRGYLSLEFSDSYIERKIILRDLLAYAKKWLSLALQISPLDLKSLLHTYLSDVDDLNLIGNISLGKTVALDIGGSLSYIDKKMFGDLLTNVSSEFISEYTIRQLNKFPASILHPIKNDDTFVIQNDFNDRNFIANVLQNVSQIENNLKRKKKLGIEELRDSLQRIATCIITSTGCEKILARFIVRIPFMILTVPSIKLGISLWTWIITERPSLQIQILTEISRNFEWSIRKRQGLFSNSIDPLNAFAKPMEYLPTDKSIYDKELQKAFNLFTPHLLLINFLSSHLQAFYKNFNVFSIISSFFRFISTAISNKKSSKHILSRELHFHLFNLGFKILKFKDIDAMMYMKTKKILYSAILTWFSRTPKWAFGGNKIQLETELNLLTTIQNSMETDNVVIKSSFCDETFDNIHENQQRLLYLLISHEKYRISTWLNVRTIGLGASNQTTLWGNISDEQWKIFVNTAWNHDPILAVNLLHRFKSKGLYKILRNLILENPFNVIDCPNALAVLFDNKFSDDITFQLKYLGFWAPVAPLTAITYFLPIYNNNGLILQYASRILEYYSLDIIFFYVPELVQALRYDTLGYIEQFIVETSMLSQLFAHQIIWNIKANSYNDEEASQPDSIKPVLDNVMERIISGFTEENKLFYEKEFNFFNEVTSISGKLKPYIKRSKLEKKEKIDLEIAKINLVSGVYLPNNPDDIVIDIDRKSGKPLQSHAKAPFIVTFRIEVNKNNTDIQDNLSESSDDGSDKITTKRLWKSSIFKVGDDCRQDVLALQLISMFRNIFNDIGLSLYVFPYRVTATAPGCGIIDVLPDSISRDMLGREAVNGLYEYFITKYGDENSIEFQKARNNFVQSMAAYSIITYILQIKDRHNGNIMIDREGHIVHIVIDFGFLLDIAPGGITFESAPFKLTREMIAVMGGNQKTQSFIWFQELCIKAFFACRPYAENIIECVTLMLDSGLPCFKGTATINNLRSRFHLDQEDHEVARTIIKLINSSYENKRTIIYDQFQSITNGNLILFSN